MGFFSWNCAVCGHPMLSMYAVNSTNSWMNDVVVITPDGSILKGEYDGYGRVNGREIHEAGEPQCFHMSCWRHVDSPMVFTKPSESAADQGYFFDEEDHAVTSCEALKDVDVDKWRRLNSE